MASKERKAKRKLEKISSDTTPHDDDTVDDDDAEEVSSHHDQDSEPKPQDAQVIADDDEPMVEEEDDDEDTVDEHDLLDGDEGMMARPEKIPASPVAEHDNNKEQQVVVKEDTEQQVVSEEPKKEATEKTPTSLIPVEEKERVLVPPMREKQAQDELTTKDSLPMVKIPRPKEHVPAAETDNAAKLTVQAEENEK